MPEVRGVDCLEVRVLPKETGDLEENPEEFIWGRPLLHLKLFQRLIIILNWVLQRVLLKLRPVPAELKLVVRVEHKQEVGYLRELLLKLEGNPALVEVVELLLKSS